jgi:hypothetical protein
MFIQRNHPNQPVAKEQGYAQPGMNVGPGVGFVAKLLVEQRRIV